MGPIGTFLNGNRDFEESGLEIRYVGIRKPSIIKPTKFQPVSKIVTVAEEVFVDEEHGVVDSNGTLLFGLIFTDVVPVLVEVESANEQLTQILSEISSIDHSGNRGEKVSPTIQKYKKDFYEKWSDLTDGPIKKYNPYTDKMYEVARTTAPEKIDKDKTTDNPLSNIFERADELSANAVMGTPAKESGYQKKIRANMGLEPDIVDWLKTKNEKHFSYVNSILRALMEAEANQKVEPSNE